jgi:carboxypeptidase Q
MHKTLSALAALSLSVSVTAVMAQDGAPTSIEAVADNALESDILAWDFVEGITTEVGPRQAGTEAEARGREWAMIWLRANGFANVANEPFEMDTWVPGELASAEIVSPFPQPFVISPLGGSASTGVEGITAEVVEFETFAALQSAPAGSLKGKIAYISHSMTPTQEGCDCHGYQVSRHRLSPQPAHWRDTGSRRNDPGRCLVIARCGQP